MIYGGGGLVTMPCPTHDRKDCSLLGSFVHGISQVRILAWLLFPSPGYLPHPGIEPVSPA